MDWEDSFCFLLFRFASFHFVSIPARKRRLIRKDDAESSCRSCERNSDAEIRRGKFEWVASRWLGLGSWEVART